MRQGMRTMLLGEFHSTADGEKLQIPAELRAELGEGLTLTRGIERCLFIYPAAEWRRLVEKIKERLPLTSREGRKFARLIFSGALACTPDPEGGIPLPGLLRQYAGIGDEAVIVGLYTHLEVWNPQRWEKVRARIEDEGVATAEALVHLNI